MKKQLLLSGALILSMSGFSQKQKQLFEGAKIVKDTHIPSYVKANMEFNAPTSNKSIGPVSQPVTNSSNSSSSNSSSSPILNATFYPISGSMNAFGFLVSASKPLNYQRILGAVSFIQRKGPNYNVSPAGDGNTGSIVAYIGKNDASTNSVASWDSTLLYANANNWGRYPVGGIWNTMPGNQNTDINKAYAVGMGPVTVNAGGWTGSWYASKSLSVTPKNAVDPQAGSVQFFSNVTPFNTTTSANMDKQDFPRYGFNVTDAGVFVAGTRQLDVNATTNAAAGLRGAAIVKGTFNSGVFVWSMDSLIPPTELRGDGSKLLGEPYLKFEPTGQTGYAMFIGVRLGATLSNKGQQPIIYKTTDGGANWLLVNGIDFNVTTDPGINQLKNSIRAVGGQASSYEAPWFWSEGIDMTIDADNKLHILATAIGHASANNDSLNYLSTWTIAGETYYWPHVNTANPLIIDYIGDGTNAWKALVVDSLGTEGPSSTSGEPGFNHNPWSSSTPDQSVSSDSRLQITRSYDGQFLAYSWAESDTGITSAGNKWNEFPDIKVRGYRTCDGALSLANAQGEEDNITLTSIAPVKQHAYFHYMSGEMKAGSSTANTATFAIPFTVSNNPATDGFTSVTNYFAMAHLQMNFPSSPCGATITTGIAATAKTEASQSFIYPNPTDNNFNVRLSLASSNDILIDVYNAIGQKIDETKVNGQIGENNVSMNMNNAKAGVYFVKVKVGTSESTKKLVVK